MKIQLPYRLAVINAFLRKSVGHRRHRVGLGEIVSTLFRSDKQSRGMRWVDHIETVTAQNRIQVWIKGMPKPFLYPSTFAHPSSSTDFAGLCSTIDEACNPSHWHQYQIAQTRVGPDDVVVDCGAAEGLFALQASLVARHVYALEPMREFVDCLTETFKGASNVTISQCCAGDADGVGQLFVDGFGSSQEAINRTYSEPTVVRSLDSLFGNLEKPVSYIKADIEGFEMNMLRGARGIIEKSKPKIALTTYHAANDVDEIERFLSSLRRDYLFLRKGLDASGKPVMLHAW